MSEERKGVPLMESVAEVCRNGSWEEIRQMSAALARYLLGPELSGPVEDNGFQEESGT